MVSRAELSMMLRPLPLFESSVDNSTGILGLHERPAPKLLVWQPDLVDWIFRRDAEFSHPGGRSLTPLFGERSLLWAEGSRHAAYRAVLGPQLRGRRLAERHDLVAAAVRSGLAALTPGTEVELLAWTRGIALRVIAGIVLGSSDGALLADITRWIDRAFGARHRTLAYRYLLGGLPRPGAELDRRLVAAARAHPDRRPATLAAHLLAGGPLGELDDAELRDSVISLLFAGHETTAAATAWTIHHVCRSASILRAVRDELAATGADGSDPTRVPLLQAVVFEALRLTPPALYAEHRLLTEDAAPNGRHLPAGTILTPAIYPAHHHPDVFGNPDRFDPTRFLDGRPPARHYFPFGGGTRHCLGNQLAQLEIRMITAALLRRDDWQCVGSRTSAPSLRGNVLAPPRGVRLRVGGDG
jgi:cytochrome P450 family 110